MGPTVSEIKNVLINNELSVSCINDPNKNIKNMFQRYLNGEMVIYYLKPATIEY